MNALLYVATMAPDMRSELKGLDVVDGRGLAPDDLLAVCEGREVRAVFTDGGTGLATPVIDALPELAIISNNGVGYDAVDAAHCARRGIVVTHTPDVLNDEVANTAIALLLAVDRRIVLFDRYVREGRWAAQGAPPFTRSLKDRTVGIVGFGRIGREIARKLSVFGCSIHYHARNRRDVPHTFHPTPVALAEACDVAILITPGGAGTHHLADAAFLRALGPEGTLVNVARGSVVDEDALVDALRSGALGAAALDVFADEPHVPEALVAMENVVLAPHVGSATVETRAAMGRLAVDNVLSFFRDGSVLTPVPECVAVADR